MALQYQTEYRLGNRGRVCRSYSGFQAFLAIGFDLVFGLLFELACASVALAVRIVAWTARLAVRLLQLYWRVLVAVMTAIVYVATLPFVWIHRAVCRLWSGAGEGDPDSWPRADAVIKPNWGLGREV
jgi:hypothetical protein